jgi:hypothetical protein
MQKVQKVRAMMYGFHRGKAKSLSLSDWIGFLERTIKSEKTSSKSRTGIEVMR